MKLPLTPLRFKTRAVEQFGSKQGVVCKDLRLTYGQFGRRCDQLAAALLALGLQPLERVAVLSYNCHRLLEAYYGVLEARGILLPLNIRLSERELKFILRDSEAAFLLYHSDFSALVDTLTPDLPALEHAIVLDDAATPQVGNPRHYEELLAAHDPASKDYLDVDEDSVAELFYTSGTTADPKGVMLTHRNLYLHALEVIAALAYGPDAVVLHTIPLFHVNGWGTPQTLTCQGGTHVLLEKFNPLDVLRLIEAERVQYFSAVPTMVQALISHPDIRSFDLSSLKTVNIGGAACAPSLLRNAEEKLGCQVVGGYGLSETSPVLTISLLKPHLRVSEDERVQLQSMAGYAIAGAEIRVVDDAGRDVARDGAAVGEVAVRGDMVMEGYWRQPEATAAAIRDGWFYTGDMATWNENGYIVIVDRKKDIIVTGGENVSSLEVERTLMSHPAVFECAVIPIPDERWGEIVMAVVVARPGASLDAAELEVHCRKSLAGFKVPRRFEFRSELPKGGTGKILKREIREPYWAGHERRVH